MLRYSARPNTVCLPAGELDHALQHFSLYYNHHRPHQHRHQDQQGFTPAYVWEGRSWAHYTRPARMPNG
ncbi:hypothetical protein [Chitinilyticum litopenaei]|uniref:hypothetical protein n=1 Tax=Chitinilyticum litopenaei TaxID=1121276 RepID=UPI001185687F|nr:hypothetical protein [Chitinilyticum litopenaei]